VRGFSTLCAVIALIAFAVYSNYGTVSPCGVLRETVRQRDGLAAVLPDSVIDLAMAAQYGALSPGRCIGILLEQRNANIPRVAQQPLVQQPQTSQPRPAPQQAPPAWPASPQASQAPRPSVPDQDPIKAAVQETIQAANDCKARRLRGELPTHVASTQCANPRMIQAFNSAHYRYMDLIQYFAAKRLEIAARVDRNELTEAQADTQITNTYASITDAERQRDAARR
jgi:hypothetical protein